MIPILYDEKETTFESNGLGRLTESTACSVTEERNGIYELELTYPVYGKHYADIKHSRIITAIPSEGEREQPFRIYKISKPLNGRVTINAEHISYQMSMIPVMPFTATSAEIAVQLLKTNAVETCPFTLRTDIKTAANFTVKKPASMRSMLGGTDGSLLDVYGGEWEFDRYEAILHDHRGEDNGVTLRYGKNITDVKQDENISTTYTGILPYWTGADENQNETMVMLPEKVLHAESAENFPYIRTIPVDFSDMFQDKPTEEQLRTAAQNYIKGNRVGVPSVSTKVSFVALWQSEEYKEVAPLEKVKLCDIVGVEFEKLGVSTKAKVCKTVFDALKERYNSIELGDARTSLAQTITTDVTTESKERELQMQRDIERRAAQKYGVKEDIENQIGQATELIRGGLGGYVVMKPDANGKPEEILILADNPDYTKATKLWRWNKNGLAYSDNGYDGKFKTAITADGKIVADFVSTGTLLAGLIKAGIITDALGKNFWNLDTGEMKMTGTFTSIGEAYGKEVKTKLGNGSIEIYIEDTLVAQVAVYKSTDANGVESWSTQFGGTNARYASFTARERVSLATYKDNNGKSSDLFLDPDRIVLGTERVEMSNALLMVKDISMLGTSNRQNVIIPTQIDSQGRVTGYYTLDIKNGILRDRKG